MYCCTVSSVSSNIRSLYVLVTLLDEQTSRTLPHLNSTLVDMLNVAVNGRRRARGHLYKNKGNKKMQITVHCEISL